MAPNHALPRLVHERSPYQGRRYATEAIRLLAGYLFSQGKYRITARCDLPNASRPEPEIASHA